MEPTRIFLATYPLATCPLLYALILSTSAHADVAVWESPGLDVWTYPSPQTPGVRTLGPTFLSSPGLDESDQFLPSTGRDPARRGMSFAAFDTTSQVEAGLALGYYKINAVTVSFTMQESTAGFVHYDDTHDTNAELLADYVTNDIDTARPMELFGLAFQAGYTGFDFGNGSGGEQPYGETTHPYSPSDSSGVLAAFPISSDSQGNYLDVSNSFTGGYSATAPGNTTEAFDALPWAVGTAEGLAPGDVVPDGTTFSFDIDLNIPGVTEYVQQGLADGALGFYLSSLHFSGNPHSGATIPYPQWYLKEFNPLFGGVPPTLEVDYSLLSQLSLPGDYNDDGSVDASDYVYWRDNLGSDTALANDDTPGVGQDDLARWNANFGAQLTTGTAAGAVTAVPEPAAGVTAVCGLLALIAVRIPRGSTRADVAD